MSDDKLIHPPALDARADRSKAVQDGGESFPAPIYDDYYYSALEAEDDGLDIRRYLFAVLRYKWLLALALVVGGLGAFYAWKTLDVTYEASGNIWIESAGNQSGAGDVAPIRSSGLLERNAWIELLRSYQVLDTVAQQERLYIESPPEFALAFADFELEDQFVPGRYELRMGESGDEFTLVLSLIHI